MSSREPLAIRASIVWAFSLILSGLVVAGAIPQEWSDGALLVINGVSVIVTVAWSRGAITPVADPRDNQGNPLTPTES